jgi:hypothetical protein
VKLVPVALAQRTLTMEVPAPANNGVMDKAKVYGYGLDG